MGGTLLEGAATLVAAAIVLAAPKADTLREKGTRAYREGRYPEACALFEQATRLSPQNGALQADLALCLAKVGRTSDAFRANFEAIRFGDARTRKNAYFNLKNLNEIDRSPPSGTPCSNELPSSIPGCEKSIRACRFPWGYEYETPHIRREGEALRVWMGTEKGPPGALDIDYLRENPALGYVEIQEPAGMPPPKQPRYQFFISETAVPGTVDVLLEHRFSFVGIDDSKEAMDSVETASEQLPRPVRCRVMAIDACQARLGLVCDEEGHDGTRGRRWAEEVDLRSTQRPRTAP
jgi:tetratricopeptide (TPR) repeat protein